MRYQVLGSDTDPIVQSFKGQVGVLAFKSPSSPPPNTEDEFWHFLDMPNGFRLCCDYSEIQLVEEA